MWPDERRAEFDQGDKHTAPIVAGSVLTLLGAAATVLAVVRLAVMRFFVGPNA